MAREDQVLNKTTLEEKVNSLSSIFPKRVLVTGASGFVAGALIPALLEQNLEVVGLVREDPPDWPWPDVERIQCDLTESAEKSEWAVGFARPNAVIHLAAVTPPGHAGANDWKVLEENGRSTERLLRACAKITPKPTVIVSSSGAVYGPGKPKVFFFRTKFFLSCNPLRYQ